MMIENNTQTAPTWVDDFLFVDVFVVAVLIFLDWLLGPEKRESLRRRVNSWWEYVQGVSFSGLASEDARRVRLALESISGQRWLSLRFISVAIAISAFLTALSYYVLGRGITTGRIENYASWVIPNAFFDWFSLAVTILFLRYMEKSTSGLFIATLVVVDIIAVILFALMTLVGFSLIYDLIVLRPLPPLADLLFKTADEMSVMIPRYLLGIVGQGTIHYSGYIVLFTSAIPTIGHLLLGLVFLGSKALRPALQSPVSLILLRFSQSEKGILTQLAVGLGMLAKLCQEAIKYFRAD